MVFSSISFLFVFLPVFLLSYALFPYKNAVVILFSLIFYTWGEGEFVYVLLISVLCNYLIGKLLIESTKRRFYLGVGITLNISILMYFKYYYFLASSVLFKPFNFHPQSIHLPIGISFFTFQSISYLIDVYKGDAKPARSMSDLAMYITMFPQLIAGPIVRFASVSQSIYSRTISRDDVLSGTSIFILGLSQKVLIANNVGEIADHVYSLDFSEVDFISAWLGSIAYSLQIFFDFSGYSLMAIGIGRIIGFEFPKNFNFPYISTSITEFWRRWHISLSSWFRDYLYIPLGGNRRGELRTYLNLFIVFVLCGLWHGAAWTFIFWGLFHGLLLIIERTGFLSVLNKTPILFKHIYTLFFINMGWVLFRSESFSQFKWMASAMVDSPSVINYSQINTLVTHENMLFGVIGIVFSMPLFPGIKDKLYKKMQNVLYIRLLFYLLKSTLLAVLFFLCTMYIMADTYNPFLYFRF